jgi:hypothetical protein
VASGAAEEAAFAAVEAYSLDEQTAWAVCSFLDEPIWGR